MPYITQEKRNQLSYAAHHADSPGELNFLLTEMCLSYLSGLSPVKKNVYTDYNDVIGALECCKLEMYRRAIAPYEDEKIAQNGDVYE
jgi:hypothetical protein